MRSPRKQKRKSRIQKRSLPRYTSIPQSKKVAFDRAPPRAHSRQSEMAVILRVERGKALKSDRTAASETIPFHLEIEHDRVGPLDILTMPPNGF
jgi:hypothetical protein